MPRPKDAVFRLVPSGDGTYQFGISPGEIRSDEVLYQSDVGVGNAEPATVTFRGSDGDIELEVLFDSDGDPWVESQELTRKFCKQSEG
jgi:hypothetical protein